jgi:hypothetical protein
MNSAGITKLRKPLSTESTCASERLAAIGATAGMVGHDIRNPLQAITEDVYLAKLEVGSMHNCQRKASIQEAWTP